LRRNSNLRWWYWLFVFGATALAVGICEILNVPQKWEDIIASTVILFTTVAVVLKRFWQYGAFWGGLSGFLVLHLIAANVILASMPIGSSGIPGLVMMGVTYVEALLIGGLLRKFMGPARQAEAEGKG
jgi:hypothetical protein